MIIEEKQNMSELEKIAVRNSNFQFLSLMFRPIGSLYWSSDPTDPSELFGGEWKQIKDAFILAAGDTYTTVDDTVRGEAAHALTVEEMPTHQPKTKISITGSPTQSNKADVLTYGGWQDKYQDFALLSIGGNQPHNNMPPYITRYCWERIA